MGTFYHLSYIILYYGIVQACTKTAVVVPQCLLIPERTQITCTKSYLPFANEIALNLKMAVYLLMHRRHQTIL